MKPKRTKKKPAHGGARAGAGRKKRDTVAITVRLHPETMAYLDCYVGSRGERIESAILTEARQEIRWINRELNDEFVAPNESRIVWLREVKARAEAYVAWREA